MVPIAVVERGLELIRPFAILPASLSRGRAPAGDTARSADLLRRRTRVLGTPGIRFYVGTLLTLGVVGALAASHLTDTSSDLLPWWAVALGYAGASWLVVHVHLGRDSHTVTLEEVPLALGLTLASPAALIAGSLIGTAAALVIVRRQPTLKLACNMGLQLCTVAASVTVRAALLGGGDPFGVTGWVITVGTTLIVAGLGGTAAVTIAMRLSGDREAVARAASILPVTLGGCVLNTLIGLGGARLVIHDAVSAAVLALPCIACVIAYQLYTQEHSERTRLSQLYESARAFGGARDVDAVVRTLLVRARELLRGERAELLLLPQSSQGEVLRVRINDQGPALVQAVGDPVVGIAMGTAQGRALGRGGRDPVAAKVLSTLEARDAVVVALRGEAGALGCLAVLDRAGDVATFGAPDLALLEAFAGQAATSLSHARLAADLQVLAYHDALTGLANRTLLLRRLEAAVRRRSLRAGDAGVVAVAYLDLDDFKTVNDSLGHPAGDRLLVEIADRLRSSLRASDLAARLGGDEFAVLFEDVEGPEEAAGIAQRLLETVRRPVWIDGAWLSASGSAGVVIAPREGEVNAETLLSQADVAMYRAKSRGKGGVELFEPSMQARVLERHRLKVDLETAVREGGLHVAYQPLVKLASREIVGVEALVRWDHPGRGAVPPAEFIPGAEETGLIHRLGAIVLEAACVQAATWQQVRPGLRMSVNVSGRQLHDPGFPAAVAEVLRRTGFDPVLLTLEVTETVMVTDDCGVREALHELRGLGCRLAIDDFGTGYSSLASLRELPVDTLKIAKPFIDGVGCGPEEDAFAEAIVGLGRTLKMTTIAEGIESPEQAQRLQALACDLGQGYLFARPLLAAGVDALLAG